MILSAAVIKTSITDNYTIITGSSKKSVTINNNRTDNFNNPITYINYNKVVQLLTCIEWTG